jgi:LuxR family maltose regulon positive regulatory protein
VPATNRTAPTPLLRRAGAKVVLAEVDDRPELPFDVVAAKIRAPELDPRAVSRTALVNRLRADQSSRAVSIVAPGGYGKSTLLAQWAVRDDRGFAWLSLDRRDNDPIVLLRHVAAAFDAVAPVDERVLETLAAASPTVWPSAVPRVAAMIAAAERFVLVLDDAHMVTDGDTAEVLAVLANHIPDGSTVVVCGRVATALTSSLRVRGSLLELDERDLAFSQREAELFLRAADVELSDDAQAELIDTAEGWAGALYLEALASRRPRPGTNGSGKEGATSSVGRSDRYVADFFHAEYLAGLTRQQLTFLRRTSLLEEMCGSLCDATLDQTHSSRELEAIRSSNLFLVPLDVHGEWYRYHHLFRDLLRRELFESEPQLVPAMGCRAADWFEEHGYPESAVDLALETGDIETAARILETVSLPTYCSGRGQTVMLWLERFDRHPLLERYPAIAVRGAYIHAMRGSVADAERWLAAAEQPEIADPALPPQIAVVQAAMCRDGIGTMLSDAQFAVSNLPEDSQWRPLALLVSAAAHLMVGDNRRADAILQEAVTGAQEIGFRETEVVATSERMLISEEAHDHAGADSQAETLVELLATGMLDTSAPCALEFAASARSHLRRGDWEGARACLDRARLLTPFLTEAVPWLSVQSRLELARTFVALRDIASARDLLDEIDVILGRRRDLGVLVEQTETLRESLADGPAVDQARGSGLTAAELRLLPLLTTHLSFREIAERLFLSRNTIKTQAISVYRKLDVSSRSDAIEVAVRLGLVDETVQVGPLVPTG